MAQVHITVISIIVGLSTWYEHWINAFLLVTLDHDKGKLLEEWVPPRILTPAEQKTACFHAMTDYASLANDNEDALFSFTVKRRRYPSDYTASHI